MSKCRRISRRRFLKKLGYGPGAVGLLASYPVLIERYIIVLNQYRLPVPHPPDVFAAFRIIIKDGNGRTDWKGNNAFDSIYTRLCGKKVYFSRMYPTYDWVNDGGCYNFGHWVEKAAKKA